MGDKVKWPCEARDPATVTCSACTDMDRTAGPSCPVCFVWPHTHDPEKADENSPSTYAGVERGWKERAEEAEGRVKDLEAELAQLKERAFARQEDIEKLRYTDIPDLEAKISGLVLGRDAWKQRAEACGYRRGDGLGDATGRMGPPT